jgi:hypothetical protein
LIQELEFDLIVVDWREILSLGEFLCAVRRSKLNQECVLVGSCAICSICERPLPRVLIF